jgi:uncharacterized protein (UPF0179 family)
MRLVNILDLTYIPPPKRGNTMTVTLIGERIAKIGFEFVYCGPIPECRECRLKNVCFALDEGRTYRITKVRDVKHECEVHEGGARVVEVEKTETPIVLDTRLAINGSTVTYSPREPCMNLGCTFFRLCFPQFIKDGEKLKVTLVGGDVTCSEGGKLTEVRISRGE